MGLHIPPPPSGVEATKAGNARDDHSRAARQTSRGRVVRRRHVRADLVGFALKVSTWPVVGANATARWVRGRS